MLRRISPTPTSMIALAVLKKGLPRIRGVLVSTSMLRTTKSTGLKKSWTLTGPTYFGNQKILAYFIQKSVIKVY
jgi:hypothetical protein